MVSVTSAQDIPMSMSMDETVQAAPELSQRCPEDRDDIERESPSQPTVNVSRDMCPIVTGVKPQACPHCRPPKFLADVISSQECSQAPPSGATPVSSQQPSPEFLMTLGIKVRDFAYENTLPAIVPVPRVPRQMQPAPLKRSHRDWDDKEGPLRSFLGQSGSKKPRSLERKATEPLQEPMAQHPRTLERMRMKKLCALVTSPSRSSLQTAARRRFSASPPTSPLTPPPSHFASQEPDLVQTSSAFPFVVRAENPSIVPASQLDSESQPPPLHPVVYTRFNLDSRSSPGRSPAPGPPRNASPSPLISTLIGLPSRSNDSDADPRDRRRRSRGTPPPSNRYHLRQRPIPSSRTSTLSHRPYPAPSTTQSLPRPARRVR